MWFLRTATCRGVTRSKFAMLTSSFPCCTNTLSTSGLFLHNISEHSTHGHLTAKCNSTHNSSIISCTQGRMKWLGRQMQYTCRQQIKVSFVVYKVWTLMASITAVIQNLFNHWVGKNVHLCRLVKRLQSGWVVWLANQMKHGRIFTARLNSAAHKTSDCCSRWCLHFGYLCHFKKSLIDWLIDWPIFMCNINLV